MAYRLRSVSGTDLATASGPAAHLVAVALYRWFVTTKDCTQRGYSVPLFHQLPLQKMAENLSLGTKLGIKWCRSGELNPGPTDYESHLSY